ncbi:MAG: penicillin-binding transpeptidase domain-containing protein [Clostridia bacterium]
MNAPTSANKRRLVIMLVIMAGLFLVLAIALFKVQVIDAKKLQEKAVLQWTRDTSLSALRGNIYDSTGAILAESGTAYKVLLRPQEIVSGERIRIATELSNVLELDYDVVLKKIENTKISELVLKRQIDRETADKINSLKLGNGVATAIDSKRFYPYGNLMAQVLGFTTTDGVGQAGLELKYNKFLSGEDGRLITEQDRKGQSLPYGVSEYIDPIDGADIVLTTNGVIESYLEKALKEALELNKAKSAQGIIMDVKTGALIAVSTQPDFDLNNPPRDNLALLSELSKNKIVTDAYEPGSTFKITTLAAAIDSGAANESYTCFCPGYKIVNGQRIKCWKAGGHGSQTLMQCAENSCNSAFMDLALRMGVDKFYDYIYKFGFGSTSGSGLLGEAGGIVTNKKYIRDTDLARIGFGQSIAVTPLQLITAASAAINGGELMQPYIMDRIISAAGDTISQTEPTVVRRVISESASNLTRGILTSVVENGSGKNAKIPGFLVGGKTGTAQKYEDGKVSSGKLIASFIGFAPAEDPRYICLILVDEPQVGVIFGSTVAAPFVKNVLEETLLYYGYKRSTDNETVVIPDLSGLTTAEAEIKLKELGLTAVFQDSDKVTAQLPASGSVAVKGSAVLLYTNSTGEDEKFEYVEVPNLVGLTRLQAFDALDEIGLVLVIDGEYKGGEIISQSILKGERVEEGTRITVKFK